MCFKRPKFIPLIMTIGGVLTMTFLGTWQVKRLMWKETLITKIEAANAQAPLTTLPKENIDDTRFFSVSLRGEYLPEHSFHIAARYFESQLGYHVFVPFKAQSGETVLINRGWIPARQKESFSEDLSGTHDIVGQIRTSNDRNPFTPVNQPEKNIWFGRDTAEMGKAAGLTLLPYTLDLIGEQNPKKLPIPTTGEIKLRNDHFGYAVTWYSIGLAILIISLLYHRKRPGE